MVTKGAFEMHYLAPDRSVSTANLALAVSSNLPKCHIGSNLRAYEHKRRRSNLVSKDKRPMIDPTIGGSTPIRAQQIIPCEVRDIL